MLCHLESSVAFFPPVCMHHLYTNSNPEREGLKTLETLPFSKILPPTVEASLFFYFIS